MTWVKLDDQFPDHPKIVKVGPLGGWLQVCGLAYCNRHLTDGFIPTEAAHRLTSFRGIGVTTGGEEGVWAVGYDPTCEDVCNALCNAKIWSKVTGGYRIHDYKKFQPSKAEVLATRAKIKERVQKHRKRNAVTNAVSNRVSNAAPVPVPETPTPIEVVEGTGGSEETGDAAPTPTNGAAPLNNVQLGNLAVFTHRNWDEYPNLVDLEAELQDRGCTPEQAKSILDAEQAARA